MNRMKENYQTAAGYSDYYEAVVAFYNTTPQADPTRRYHHHLTNMKARTAELQHSIANLVRKLKLLLLLLLLLLFLFVFVIMVSEKDTWLGYARMFGVA